jgi:hypothetical protein
MSKIKPYKSLVVNILNTTEYSLLSYNRKKNYIKSVLDEKILASGKFLTFTWVCLL